MMIIILLIIIRRLLLYFFLFVGRRGAHCSFTLLPWVHVHIDKPTTSRSLIFEPAALLPSSSREVISFVCRGSASYAVPHACPTAELQQPKWLNPKWLRMLFGGGNPPMMLEIAQTPRRKARKGLLSPFRWSPTSDY